MQKFTSLIVVLTFGFFIIAPSTVSAVTASDWRSGRIIDDNIFTDASSMSAADIQTFLNAKVPSCDTAGTKPYNGSSQTRAQWAIANGKQQPQYTCLRDFYEVPKASPGLLYTSWRSHVASDNGPINSNNSNVEFADLNGDGREEAVRVDLSGTASGKIEFRIWNNDMRSLMPVIISNQEVVDPTTNEVKFADINGDGRQEPVLIGLSGTGSGKVEFHVWGNDMKTWVSHTASSQPTVNPTTTKILFADQVNQKRDFAVLIGMSGTTSGKVEFHTWNSDFTTWTSNRQSNQPVVDPTKNIVDFADTNGDGRQEPVLIGLSGTGSGKVEFHVWDGTQSSYVYNLTSNQPVVDPTKNIVDFADTNGDGRQEPVLIGLSGTGSGKVEFHVWEPGKPASNYGGQAIPSGAKSAAQLIWDAAQKYSISPKVLLTTIQKESAGPLTIDDWPFESQYTYAMGAYCPDSGPDMSANCDPDYAGFSIQISESAALMRYYLDNMNQPWWPYKKVGTNSIQYHPNVACGSTQINITTKATAALYTYTPYQPNQAALSNMNGEGDGCSAYGNRNFWRIYNDWFGKSIVGECLSNEQPASSVTRFYNATNFKHFYTPYECEGASLQRNGYKLEGNAFYQTTAGSPTAVVVHRLYNPSTQLHLWVTTQDEINSATQKSGFRYEGVAFYAVKPETQGAVVVHRLYNPSTFLHLWVTTQDEINSATQKSGFRYEGVAFYAAPAPN